MVRHRFFSVLLLLALLLTSAIPPVMADKPSPEPTPEASNPAGPAPSELYLGMTPEERDLAIKKEADCKSQVSVNSPYYYKSLDVPYYEQERGYWCGPASGRGILVYLGQTAYTQSYLAGPYDPGRGLYGMETTEKDGTFVWKYARTLTDLDGKPSTTWVWSYVNNNGSVSNYKMHLKYDLNNNMPQANRDKTLVDGYYLKGFVNLYYHYIVACGLDEDPLNGFDDVRYTNSYENPGPETSLGRWWWPASHVANCNVKYEGGWVVY